MRDAYGAAQRAGSLCPFASGTNGAGRRQARRRGSTHGRARCLIVNSTSPCTSDESFSLERNPAGRLVLTRANGETHAGVEPVRTFPISDPDRFISLVD